MSLEQLDLILKKDPIVTTYPVASLISTPAMVEQVYGTHAKTYLSLGDTQKYVETIFRWVGGPNKGTFVGAVEGNYGEGKTSFLIHVWSESAERKVFAVPPFEWTSLSEAVDGVAAWLQYILGTTHPPLAKQAKRVHETFKEKTLEEIAKGVAAQTGQDYDDVLKTLTAAGDQGGHLVTGVSPARFLNYCADATGIVKQAGFQGLLVLLDEPEVAAKKLSGEEVAHILFDLADELHVREGDYGVFVSMPSNFLAYVLKVFPALTARLEARKCFPRLRDLYGPDFAKDLWSRYVKGFALDDVGNRIVSPLALQAIGQVGSSERSDLSYGPRTVVSAFNQMVFRYRQTSETYEPADFVQDCLADEILVHPEYKSKVREVLRSPEVNETNRGTVTFLAAFPNGLQMQVVKEKGFEKSLLDLSHVGGPVFRTALTFGLKNLRKGGIIQEDEVKEAIEKIAAEFAPNRACFANAVAAFVRHFMPLLFQPRKGSQLVGWEEQSSWKRPKGGAWLGSLVGAFPQTQRNFPSRAILVLVSSVDDSLDDVPIPGLPMGRGPLQHDAIFHFRLRWHTEQELPADRVEIKVCESASKKLSSVKLTLDLLNPIIPHDRLAEVADERSLTPFWWLNALHRMDSEPLSKEFEGDWLALRTAILRELVGAFLTEDLTGAAATQLKQPMLVAGLDLLGSIFHKILLERYPTYSTLMCAPQWEQRVNDYITALASAQIPLACKRGREIWCAEGEAAPLAFGTSRMNLTGGALSGLDNLVVISSKGKNAPVEVEFRIHPFEQQAVDLITSERGSAKEKIKVDGKDCWWILMEDLLPVIRTSGYTVEELNRIVEIGKARGSFGETTCRGERVLFCKPIDPQQMRHQLSAKLAALQEEIEDLSALPDFVSHFDAVALQQRVDAVQDDADYDGLNTLLNREFEQLHSRIPGYFQTLQSKLDSLRLQVKDLPAQVSGAREVTSLKTLPSGKSRWCADLGKYIVTNLKRSVDDVRSKAVSVKVDLDKAMAKFAFKGLGRVKEHVAVLTQGNSALLDFDSEVRKLKQRWDDLLTRLRDYEEWLRLLRRSDEVYESLLQLRCEELHQVTANQLLAQHDALSGEISEHLEVRNVDGLQAHRQFMAKLDEIDEERRRYLLELKGGFDQRKSRVNSLLESLKTDRRVTTVFNPMAVEACYTEMFELAAQHISEAVIGQSLTESAEQRLELLYAHSVLRCVEDAEATPALERLSRSTDLLTKAASEVSRDWVGEVTGHDKPELTQELIAALDNAHSAVRDVRKLVKEKTRATLPSNGRPKSMYDLIPEKDRIDLKQLILQTLSRAEDPSRVLDQSLESMVDLFKRNCVQITIERRRT